MERKTKILAIAMILLSSGVSAIAIGWSWVAGLVLCVAAIGAGYVAWAVPTRPAAP